MYVWRILRIYRVYLTYSGERTACVSSLRSFKQPREDIDLKTSGSMSLRDCRGAVATAWYIGSTGSSSALSWLLGCGREGGREGGKGGREGGGRKERGEERKEEGKEKHKQTNK